MLRFLLVLPLLLTLALACSDSDDNPPAATATTTPPLVSETPRPTVTPAATAVADTTPTSVPRVDGTIDPLGFGGTDPVSVKSNPDPITGVALLRDVRVGAHPEEGGWDRIVFEFADTLPSAQIEYVTSAVGCGSGLPVTVQGSAILTVRMTPVNAHTDAGQPTTKTQVPGPGGVILEAKSSCDFEAHVNWEIGVKSKQRFKVTRLQNPTRLVIDIKQ